jgi:hypothetical protein
VTPQPLPEDRNPRFDGSSAPDGLRVVIVSQRSAANEYVLSELAAVCQVQRVFTHVASPPAARTRRAAWERLRREPLALAVKPGRRAVLHRFEAGLNRRVGALLPTAGTSAFEAVERGSPLPI